MKHRCLPFAYVTKLRQNSVAISALNLKSVSAIECLEQELGYHSFQNVLSLPL